MMPSSCSVPRSLMGCTVIAHIKCTNSRQCCARQILQFTMAMSCLSGAQRNCNVRRNQQTISVAKQLHLPCTLLCAKASRFSKSKALNKPGGHWINRRYGSQQLPRCTTVQQCGACAKEVPNQVFIDLAQDPIESLQTML